MNFSEQVKVLIITLSDRAFKGEYKDLSGPRIREIITDYFPTADRNLEIEEVLIPDNEELLRKHVLNAVDKYHFIFTTGGTGIGPRDITVETIRPLLSKEIPGIMEFIRVKYGSVKPAALLSRGVAGVIGQTLIYTLPGSVKAVNEYMIEIVKTLEHTIEMLHGIDTHNKF